MIQERCQKIYNNHLVTSKLARHKPYRVRKNFDDVTDTVKMYLNKLDSFFHNYSHINQDLFFKAPYVIYPEDSFFELKYFISPKALNDWKMFMNRLDRSENVSDDLRKWLKCSYIYIKTLADGLKKPLNEFVKEKIPVYDINILVSLVKSCKISVYSLVFHESWIDELEKSEKKLNELLTSLGKSGSIRTLKDEFDSFNINLE